MIISLTRFTAAQLVQRLGGATLLLAALLLAPPTLRAQQTLADADWFVREVGDGVVLRHYLFDNLFGSKQSVSYIEADLDNPNVNIEFPYLEAARQKTSTMTPAQFPTAKAAINGSYFETGGSGGHKTYLRINGAAIPLGGDQWSPWGIEGGLAINNSGVASIRQRPGSGWVNLSATYPDVMANGPLVTWGGTVPTADLTAIGAHCTARHPRSAVGVTSDNRLILFAVDGRTDMSAGMTCAELGQIMDELGCPNALNLDGGGSTTLWAAGEPYSGVVNYPSDNGTYDHLGERGCSNAIAVTSTNASPAQWDARMTTKTFNPTMATGAAQMVTLKYTNIGTGTWTSSDVKLVVARPNPRASVFHHPATWQSSTQPAVMTPATVAPGQTATFSFTMQAPAAAVNAVYDEHFMLTRTGVGRIGPADSEAWMRIAVQVPVAPQQDFIVESRPGGHNYAWYSDSGMADTGLDYTAAGSTPNLGSRWGSTFRGVAGSKKATIAPDFPGSGFYNVYVAWPAASDRRNPITYHVKRPGVTNTYQVDQSVSANTWVRLGTAPFHFEKGLSGSVEMTNENIDESGGMYMGGVKFEYVASQMADKTYEVRLLGPAANKPVIDGAMGASEWTAAAPAGQGFVQHNNPATPAAQDASFQMLADSTHLYFLFRMNNPYMPGWTVPPNPYGYSNLGNDKINFFLTPLGPDSQRFYRLVFSPNPTNGTCYVWSQASPVKSSTATVGTDWNQRGGAAYSYVGGQLTIEYRIAWSQFNYSDIAVAGAPQPGDVWGIQPCLSNQLTAGSSESVNWEPDATGGFVNGEPFGNLQFTNPTAHVGEWSLY